MILSSSSSPGLAKPEVSPSRQISDSSSGSCVPVEAVALLVGDQDLQTDLPHDGVLYFYPSRPSLLTAARVSAKVIDLGSTSLAPASRNLWTTSRSSRWVSISTGTEGLASCSALTSSSAPSSGRGISTMAASIPP